MKNPNQLVVFVIVNDLLRWSENFITRELVELRRQGLHFYIGARRIVVREDLSEAERALSDLVVTLPENPFTPSCLLKHIRFKIKHIRPYLAAWLTLVKMRPKAGKAGRSLVCLFRAVTIAEKIQKIKINLIHAHFLNAPGDTAVFLSKLTGIPYGGTGHAQDIYRDNSGLKTKVSEASYLTTCTEANLQFLRQYDRSEPSKIYKVYHGIAPINQKRTGPSDSPFTFVAAGRLIKKKGFEYLISACALLKGQNVKFNCSLIGTGPLREQLESQVTSSGLSHQVKLLGYVAPNQMDEIYETADALVVPSIIDDEGDQDGLPNVCLEAMNHGLPIIGSFISGIPEGVRDTYNGYLVPPSDAKKLSDAMLKLMTSSDLVKMQDASKEMVRKKFDLKKNVLALKTIMEKNYLK